MSLTDAMPASRRNPRIASSNAAMRRWCAVGSGGNGSSPSMSGPSSGSAAHTIHARSLGRPGHDRRGNCAEQEERDRVLPWRHAKHGNSARHDDDRTREEVPTAAPGKEETKRAPALDPAGRFRAVRGCQPRPKGTTARWRSTTPHRRQCGGIERRGETKLRVEPTATSSATSARSPPC